MRRRSRAPTARAGRPPDRPHIALNVRLSGPVGLARTDTGCQGLPAQAFIKLGARLLDKRPDVRSSQRQRSAGRRNPDPFRWPRGDPVPLPADLAQQDQRRHAMSHHSRRVAAGFAVAASLFSLAGRVRPERRRQARRTSSPPAGQEPAKEAQKVDEFAEAPRVLERSGRQSRNASGSAGASSACCGATISTPPSAISISTTASAARAATSRRRSAAWSGRQQYRSEGDRHALTPACMPAGSTRRHSRRQRPPPRRRARPQAASKITRRPA